MHPYMQDVKQSQAHDKVRGGDVTSKRKHCAGQSKGSRKVEILQWHRQSARGSYVCTDNEVDSLLNITPKNKVN